MKATTKLLYVDDEVLNLYAFQISVSKHYEVHIAKNGNEGLEILAKNPDIPVIISDMNMPGMNGIEFINKAKELYPEKKFYILTGYEITKEIKNALESGLILEYFSKPFNVKHIESTIENAM